MEIRVPGEGASQKSLGTAHTNIYPIAAAGALFVTNGPDGHGSAASLAGGFHQRLLVACQRPVPAASARGRFGDRLNDLLNRPTDFVGGDDGGARQHTR